ncbi:reverse transcriptase domain-containing protein [Tanacetum coccineum]
MREDSKILIILGRPFLATARVMIDVFNKKITLRLGNEEVIFDIDQSTKRPPTEDDECYGTDFLDTTIHSKTHELLADDQLDLFLVNNLEDSIDLSDLENYGKANDQTPIRRIEEENTPYSRGTERTDQAQNEHLYSASANKINEKRPVHKDLPSYLEYAYLKGDESCLVIISSKLTRKEKISLLQVSHVVSKKGGMTVVLNDNTKLIPSRTVTGWQVCIDYHKLNDATRKDHFPLPFIDQMLEQLSGNEYYCFLDGFLRRMSFRLCNTPETFQRCMMTIFYEMVEDFMEVFIDDFSVFGHKISRKGIEVDKAKINVIAKVPYPSNAKGVRSFMGHAGFYRRFIKDFSMISKLMTQLFMKDAKFDFSEDCKKSFNKLKEKLTTAPIIISPDWNEPFELICDASDFAVGAVLGQKIDGIFKPIYYASKTLNDAPAHYTTTKKELLAVVFSFDKFHPYLILSKTIVYIVHSALKYLFNKQNAKTRLIRWVLLLQGFKIKIKDKKGAENLAADHLTRPKNPDIGELAKDEITDKFLDEHLMILKDKLNDEDPWYADYINYIVRKFIPPKWTPKRKKTVLLSSKELFLG